MGTIINLEDLEALKPGLILAEPLFNQFGQMLLASGTELQARHVTVLKTWGFKVVTIQSLESEEKIPEISPEMWDRARDRVQWRMKWEPVTDLEKGIHYLAVKRAIEKLLHP